MGVIRFGWAYLRGSWQELVFPGASTTAAAAITFFVYVLFITWKDIKQKKIVERYQNKLECKI